MLMQGSALLCLSYPHRQDRRRSAEEGQSQGSCWPMLDQGRATEQPVVVAQERWSRDGWVRRRHPTGCFMGVRGNRQRGTDLEQATVTDYQDGAL
jgi:hypothetical protein